MARRTVGYEPVPRALFLFAAFGLFALVMLGALILALASGNRVEFMRTASSTPQIVKWPPIDREEYDLRMWSLAHASTTYAMLRASSTAATSTGRLWPVTNAPYPRGGALLPFKRIVAYYGNLYSKQMGALGEYPREQMLRKLSDAASQWSAADPTTPVVPAIHYIVTTAQALPGQEGLYRLRMPDSEVDKALSMAREIDGLLFLDVQVGRSDPLTELREYEKYLMLPEVHVGIDPEFAMAPDEKPGDVVGTYDATDVNEVARYLAGLVQKYDLPPKVLIVHRFTQGMLTHARQIRPLPEVQIVIDMDGWGSPAKKINTYKTVIQPEPVQFTGFKLFYKNDLRAPSPRMMTPDEVLSLTPAPIYIQYQ